MEKNSQLPSNVTLKVSVSFNIEENGAELLSAKYGWLVLDFSHELIKKTADSVTALFTNIHWDTSEP